MSAPTTGGYDLELFGADNTWIGLMLAVDTDGSGTPQPKTLHEVLAAQDDEVAIRKRLAADIQEDWSGGVGIAYNIAPGVYTRTPGYALSAGAATDITVNQTHPSNSNIVAIEEFGGDVWLAQQGDGAANTGRVMRSVGGTGALSESLLRTVGNYVNDLAVFDDGLGIGGHTLWASGSGATASMSRWNPGAGTWTTTTGHSAPRGKLAKTFWTIDGVRAPRLVAGADPGLISYTRPYSDPLLDASWVNNVRIDSAYAASSFAFARTHVWTACQDGLFDLLEGGDGPNIFPAAERMRHPMNGYSSLYLDGYVYMSLGNGLVRVLVDQGSIVDENVGQCAPGWGTQAEHQFRGWSTALCAEQGWVVDAVYNPTSQRTGIFWGRDRRVLGVSTPNPLVWHGPEITSSQNLLVTAMRPISSGTAGAIDLWIAATAYGVSNFQFSGVPLLAKVSLPLSGAPLDDLISGGPHRFTKGDGTGIWQATSQLELLKLGGTDRASTTVFHQHTLVTRGLGGGTKLTLATRADAAPGATTYATTDDATVSPSQTITPQAAVVAGNLLGRRLTFVNVSTTAIGVLDACRTTYWKIVPSFDVRLVEVAYGDGVQGLAGGTDPGLSPDQITANLVATTRLPRTLLRDRQDNRWTVRLEQVADRVEQLGDGVYGKSVRCRLELTVIPL